MIKILLSTTLGEKRWTQSDLTKITGIRPNTIDELYHELVDRVNLEHLDLICEALDCQLEELIVRVHNKKPKNVHRKWFLDLSRQVVLQHSCYKKRHSKS